MDSDGEKGEKWESLAKSLTEHLLPTQSNIPCSAVAAGILAHPQAHLDALVASGVLKVGWFSTDNRPAYVVEQPHVHDWCAEELLPIGCQPAVTWSCATCSEVKTVPIEAPDA